ncbi:MAG: branched-chain amino acid ABC transporter permease [Clostridiales bacterium]|nr:branched-chain amino acid ABC transporter permease [Clostridiales bacterium]
MNTHKAALKAALPYTLPVLSGYIVLGAAYGILMNNQGISLFWIAFSSIFIYAGSMQFVTVALLSTGFDLPGAFLMTLMVNARHLFYGISFLQKYRNMGLIKPYLIFSLTDETFSLLCSAEVPKNISRKWFYFYISFLDQLYWVIGSLLGGFLGGLLKFDTNGLEFVLTALFVVIFINQWKATKNHIPAIIGLVSAIMCRVLFGATDFIIPSMIVILLSVTLLRSPLERRKL